MSFEAYLRSWLGGKPLNEDNNSKPEDSSQFDEVRNIINGGIGGDVNDKNARTTSFESIEQVLQRLEMTTLDKVKSNPELQKVLLEFVSPGKVEWISEYLTKSKKSLNTYASDKKKVDLFELQVHNLNSVVRSYSLQSKIFPNQGAIIAIGSQAQGGELGIQNNTIIDWNKGLLDRVVPKKTFPVAANALSSQQNKKEPKMANSLATIVLLLASLNAEPGTGTDADISALSSRSKTALRDLIVYFQSIVNSPGANRNLIPTKFSFEMDGIGGLVIGHLFTINDDILPKGYKYIKGSSSILAQTITNISHTIGNSDWTTNIDALNIILDDIKSSFNTLDINNIVQEAVDATITDGTNLTPAPPGPPPPGGNPPPPGGNPPTKTAPGKKDPNAGKIHSYTNQDAVDFLLSNGKQVERPLNKITSITLHHTNGYSNGSETLTGMKKPKNKPGESVWYAGIHYAIDIGGGICTGVPLTHIANHADNYNSHAVGIEICNIGGLREDKNKNFVDCTNRTWTPDFTNKNPLNSPYIPYCYLQDLANTNRPTGWGGEVYNFQYKWAGYQYYQDYTDIQLAALKQTIESIITQCTNIKKNYTNDYSSILYNVFGIEECAGGQLPKLNGNYVGKRNISRYKPDSSGIFIHGTSPGKKANHNDTHPSRKMLDMIKSINW